MSNYVPGIGPHEAKLMIVGEAPGADEDIKQTPFTGPAGHILDGILRDVGISRDECYITNVYKYRPPENNIKRIAEVCKPDENIEQLWNEIKAVSPNAIIALGNTALFALCNKSGITQHRGSILLSQRYGIKVIPTIHPAALLYQYESKGGEKADYSSIAYITFDIKRAVEESKTKDYHAPIENIKLARTSLDVHNFLSHARKGDKVAIDIEVIHAIPVCIALAFCPTEAMSIPLLNVGNCKAIPSQDQVAIYRILENFFLKEPAIIGQNFKFDHDKLRKVCRFSIKKDIFFDTMMAGHTLHSELPKSLQFLTSIYTKHPYYKDEGKEFNIFQDAFDKFMTYNAKDAIVTFAVYEALKKELAENNLTEFFSYVMKLHSLYMDIEDEGFYVNFDKQLELIDKYIAEKKECQAILGDVNVNSHVQVKALFKILGLPARDSSDEETIVALINNHAKSPEQIHRLDTILKLRRIGKTLSTYLMAEPDYDGRMKTAYQICGTETGRSSTKKVQPPVRPVKMGLSFHNLTKHGETGADLRAFLCPDPGHLLLEADLSQAEARIVALLARDEDTLKLFDTTDIHTLTATWIFNKSMDEIDRKTERFIGKTTRHAGNYGMGKRRFSLNVTTDARKFGIPIQLSEKRAGEILDIFHKRTPKIQGIFHAEIKEYVLENARLVNPFGRLRQFFGRPSEDMFREADATLPQGTVIDHLRRAMLRIKDRYPVRFVAETHDACCAIVPEKDVAQVAKIFVEELTVPIDFSNCSLPRGKLIIPAEVKVGENYKDMKDYVI